MLDDALQSVDATVRRGVMSYVLDEFKDWQIVITGHDRAWQEQLRELFIRKNRVFVERRVALVLLRRHRGGRRQPFPRRLRPGRASQPR